MKNRIVAGLLAIFGGAFGAHKFYLRKPGSGIFYVFMFMVFLNARFPIMFMIGLFEGLRLLMMSDQEFNRKYNGGIQQQQQQSYGRGFPWQQQPQERPQNNMPWKNIQVPEASFRRNVYKESGLRKYKEFDLEGAIEDFQKSLQMEPRDVATHFNIACAYSLTEQGDKSYQHIVKAVEYGFNDFEKLNNHDDLAYDRIQAQWDDFKASGYRSFKPFEKTAFEPVKPEPQNDLLLDQLNKLNELKQKGLISDAEYVVEKRRLE
ncbi:MAG: NINE protein [Saprospiraceae bacterium]